MCKLASVENVTTVAPEENGCSFCIPREFLCGGLASTVNVIVVFPLHKTIFFQQLDGITWAAAFRSLQMEGIRRLYRGVLPPLLQRGASASVMFGFQSQTEKFLFSHPKTSNLPLSIKIILSASAAGCLEASLTPFERIQTLLQNPKYAYTYKNTPHALSIILRHHGIAELYRGVTPIIIRNCFGNILYFYGKCWLFDKSHSNELPGYQRHVSDFIIGGVLGSAIGILIFPLSVAKTRMQSVVGTNFISLHSTLSTLLNEGGVSSVARLYSGLPASIFRSMFSWGIITMAYEWLLQIT